MIERVIAGLREFESEVEALRFGDVTVSVQDGVVILVKVNKSLKPKSKHTKDGLYGDGTEYIGRCVCGWSVTSRTALGADSFLKKHIADAERNERLTP